MADNNTIILFYVLTVFFVVIGLVLPLFNEFGLNEDTKKINGVDELSGLDFLTSLLTVVFWSFNVNTWVNLIFLEPLRILFYVIVYRIINPFA